MDKVNFRLNGSENSIEVSSYKDLGEIIREKLFSKDAVFKIEIREVDTRILLVEAITLRGFSHGVGYIFDSFKDWMKNI